MTRTKRGNVARKRRKKVLSRAKGFRGGFSKLFRPANQAVLHALSNAYKDRRRKKRDYRALWIMRISGALMPFSINYSKFMGGLKKEGIALDRKMLSELSIHYPVVFKEIVLLVKDGHS